MGDFGLSVLVRGDGRTERAGTLEYMAPEVQRSEVYSAGADVWSFGCVALFAWAGKHPTPEVYEALCGELNGSPDVKALGIVARRCVKVEPSDRPAFSALLQCLRRSSWPETPSHLVDDDCGASLVGPDTSTVSHVSVGTMQSSMPGTQDPSSDPSSSSHNSGSLP